MSAPASIPSAASAKSSARLLRSLALFSALKEGWMINASLSRQDIAELADTTTETAIRVMSKLRARNLIKIRSGGFVVIFNPQELKELAES